MIMQDTWDFVAYLDFLKTKQNSARMERLSVCLFSN